jgi:putative lysine transport system ATP-binding protein
MTMTVQTEKLLLSVRELSKSFGNNHILRNISFDVQKKDIISIIGASGSGKSTLLRCINLLERPDAGRIIYQDQDVLSRVNKINRYRSRVGMVFQSFNLFKNMTVMENCVTGQIRVLKRSREDARKRALHFLDKVGMGTLCQGQAQTAVRRPAAAGGYRPGPGHGSGSPAF